MTEQPGLALNTVLGLFIPHRLHMRLAGEIADYSPDQAQPARLATWVHEYVHFLQTITSGYGHITWDSHRQLTGYLVNEWRAIIGSEEGRARIPLAHAAGLSPEALMRAIVARRTAEDWTILERSRFSPPNPSSTLSGVGMRLARHPWATTPSIRIAGQAYYLPGKYVIEAHAQAVEATFIERHLHGDASQLWDPAIIPAQYWLPRQWFVTRCGHDRLGAFPAICDLALQTSWRAIIPTTEVEWRASHPGWRFVQLVEAFSKRRDLNLEDVASWPRDFANIGNELLTTCGYAVLEDVVSERLASFKRKPQLLEFERLMRDAIEFKAAAPWCCANPAVDIESFEQLTKRFHVPIVEIRGRIAQFGSADEKMAAEIVMELQLQALAMQVYGEFSRIAADEGAIECAFAKFGIHQGCEYQRTHNCLGRYRPSDGPPHPVVEVENGVLSGCSFEMLLRTCGLQSRDLDCQHAARLPSD